MKLSIINRSTNPLPAYQTSGSAGVDLRAYLEQPVTLQPLERQLIPTGLHIALPNGYEAQIRARSGLSTKHGITLINAVGTIDSDYRGEIKIGLVNLSNQAYTIEPGERVAQMIISQYEQVKFELVDELDETDRGEGGFGSTDKK
ncbi:MAG: dUTP diphosphatase [Tissierellia bacterium]|jgi:dUTP pyrophosphatase|nr:dUTP diphosphatase [Tissierellia bacterium]